MDLAQVPKSAHTEIAWPAFPGPTSAALLALQHQFEQSQWWPAETLLQYQLRQLDLLIAHAARTVPFYHHRLRHFDELSRGELTLEAFRRIPIMRRSDIQEFGPALVSRQVPKDHEPISEVSTSGSTGRPITVKRTAVAALFDKAFNLRNHLWHRRDFSAKSASIRSLKGDAAKAAIENRPVNWVDAYPSGPRVLLLITTPVGEQLDWLVREEPEYLLTYPSNLLALVRRSEEVGVRLPKLREVATIGEVLDPSVRDACDKVWGVPVVDGYSAFEIGAIALQCPEHPHYHVQGESVLVEVLDEDGAPCAPHQAGRVVLTGLHDFATPLIRYEIGDYAEVGEPCPCGRGLPVLTRILGRSRGMLTLPSGEQLWPRFRAIKFGEFASVRQFQLIQRNLHEIEVKLVVTQPLTSAEEERIGERIGSSYGHPFALNFVYVDEIPRAASGKFEDFRSEIET